MKKLILFLAFTSFGLSAQTSAEAYNQISNLVNDGIKKFNEKDNYGAIANYSKAVELIPYLNSPSYLASIIYSNRALAKKAIGDYKNAIVDLDKALEAYGSDTNIKNYIFRGEMKLLLEDYYSAISDFSKVIKIDPKHNVAYLYRGNSKYILNDYYGAIKDFTTVIKLNPSESNTANIANAYSYRGLSKEELGDDSGACKDFKKGAELGGDFHRKLQKLKECN